MGRAHVVKVPLRAWLMLVALALALPLLGASGGFPAPSVVVYPITSTGPTDPAAGGNIALLVATKFTQLGGVTVKPPTPGTERAHYLDAALALGADYYVTGFLTPLGNDNSLITQVVSTHSGSVVFSTTASVRTYTDAVAQADTLRDAILRHAGRGLAALDAPPPRPSSSPPSATSEGNVNITKALRKRAKATRAPTSSAAALSTASAPSSSATPATAATIAVTPAGPSAAPARTASPPSRVARAPAASATPRGAALLFVATGAVDDTTRAHATAAVASALQHAGIATATLGVTAENNLVRAADICRATPGTTALYAESLVVGANEAGTPSAQLDVTAYDCTGTALRSERAIVSAASRSGIDGAIDRAAARVAGALASARRP